jgi:hypothetical protein
MPPKVNNNYQNLRAALIAKGTNLSRWARSQKLPPTTVYLAARGLRSGIKATRIRKQLEIAAYE